MASQQFYDGGSGISSFDYNFPSLKDSDIKVTVDGEPVTAFSISGYNPTTGGQVNITSGSTAPGTLNVRVYRQTEPETLSATFVAGSSITANDLNNCNKQTLFLADENKSAINNLASTNPISALQINGSHIADGSISSSKIENLQVKAVDLSSHTSTDSERAVTTDHIRDGAVTDAKLASGITGSKVSPDFGSQNIITTGTLSSGNISGNHASFNGEVYIGGPTGTAADTRYLDTHISTTHAFHIRGTEPGDQSPHNVICSFGHNGTIGTVTADTFSGTFNGNGNMNRPAWYMTHPRQIGNNNSEFPVTANTNTIIGNYQINESGTYDGGGLSATNGSFTVPTGKAGMYLIFAGVIIIDLDENDDLNVFFFKDGNKLTPIGENNSPGNNVNTGASIIRLGNFNAGEVIQAGVKHSHGSTSLNLQGENCYFGGFRLAL